MRLRDRLGPYLFAIANAHHMIHEALLTPGEHRAAVRDAKQLAGLLPFVADYARRSRHIAGGLERPYRAYTSNVSPAPISISLELATFLGTLCAEVKPSAILDLGSGFSSYVFRCAALHGNRARVFSVDDSPAWLEQTRGFLREQGVGADDVLTWDALRRRADRPRFDLVLLDFGDLDVRLRLLDAVVAECRAGALLVIDDMHVPSFRRQVLRALERRSLACYSLRRMTRRRLRYAYLVRV